MLQREPVSKRRTVCDCDGPPGSPGVSLPLDLVSTGSTNRAGVASTGSTSGPEWSRQARPAGAANGVHFRWRSTHPQFRQESQQWLARKVTGRESL